MHRGARRAALEAGFRLYWNAPTREDDVDRQIHLMARALHDNTRGLILGPTNGLALTATMNEFIVHRIPIVVVQTDTPIPEGPYMTSVSPDQAQVSQLAVERILATISRGEVAVVGLDRTAPETMERARNFVAQMNSHPAIRVVAQRWGTSLIPEAEQDAGEVLDKFPRLKAMFAVSATATEGAVSVIQRRGLGRSIILIGCDADLFLMADLQAGRLDSLIASDGDRLGYLAAKSLLSSLQGHPLPPPLHIPVRLITASDLARQDSQ